MKNIIKYIYVLILVSFSFSQFNWSDDGISIRQGYHIEWQRTSDVGDNGEIIFAWSDTRIGDRDVYAKKIDINGNDLWGPDGIAVINAFGRQEDPQLVSDGQGGAYIIWKDYRDEPDDGDFYAQHILSDGSLAWSTSGIPLSDQSGAQTSPNLCKDGLGGAFAIWKDASFSGIPNLYGTHLSSEGVINPGAGVLINSSDLAYGGVSLETAAEGSAVLVWSYSSGENQEDLFAQRIDLNCNTLWSSPEEGGIPIYEGLGVQESSRVTYYSELHSIIVWEDDKSGNDDIYAQFITMDGSLVFSNPIEVSSAIDRQYKPRVKANNLGAYVIWSDLRDNQGATPVNNDIYMQRLTVDGGLEWEEALAVANSSNLSNSADHTDARLTVDSFGSAFVTWMDDKAVEGSYDISAQKINSDGILLLDSNNSTVCNAPYRQGSPIVRDDGNGGAFIIWGDSRDGSIGIYAQHIDGNGDISLSLNGIQSFWGIDGNTVGSFSNKPKSVYLGNNETVIYWTDQRFGQELKNFGQKIYDGWDSLQNSDGYVLSNATEQNNPKLSNNVNTLLHIFPESSSGDIKLNYQALDRNLNILDANDSGNLVNESSSSPHYYDTFDIEYASDGNYFLAFSELEFFAAYNIFIQKFDVNGIPYFSSPLSVISNFGADDNVKAIHEISDQGLLIIYESESFLGRRLKSIAVDYSGNILSGANSDGVNVCDFESNQSYQSSVKVDGGVFVIWNDDRGDGDDIYGQLIDLNGSVSSEALGIEVAAYDSYQQNPSMIYNSLDSELFLCWQDYVQNSYYDISCRTVDLNNDSISLNSVFKIADTSSANQTNPFVLATQFGDYLITWQDSRNYTGAVAPNDDIYLQHLSNGNIIFESNGIPVCSAVFSQTYPQIELYDEEENSYVIFWNDLRSSGKAFLYNVYAQSISLSSCVSGDLNEDTLINVQDIIALVNAILAPNSLADICAADLNGDNQLNVQDIVALVNLILSI